MLRVNKMTDYAIRMLAHMGTLPSSSLVSASELAEGLALAYPTVSKLLRILQQAGFLHSSRGTEGGYMLSDAPETMRVLDIMQAVEGNTNLVECLGHTGSEASNPCAHKPFCRVHHTWERVDAAVRQCLEKFTVLDFMHHTGTDHSLQDSNSG